VYGRADYLSARPFFVSRIAIVMNCKIKGILNSVISSIEIRNFQKYFTLSLVLLITQMSLLEAGEYYVKSASEIYSLISTIQPGDTITMSNGTWKDQHIVFHANGTQEKPILIRAETPGYVRLQGNSYLKFSGSWITVNGLLFRNGYCASGQSVIEFRSSFGRANHCRLTNSVIVDYNPSDKNIDYKWVSLYGRNNRVDHCHFEGKNHSGTTFVIWLDKESDRENYHQIDHNYFGPRPELGYNGGETIRIGTSDYSLTNSNSIVEYNVFEECNGETEIISSKSCENIYQYNTFINCKGCLTLRHGERCIVRGNYFFGNRRDGTGGVRIIGADHQVYNNYFDGLNGSGYSSALCIVKGVQDSPLNRYYQVERALVAFNTFINCGYSLLIGYGSDSDQTLPPKDCIIANNAIQTNYQVVKIGDSQGAPVNFTWEGNIFYGSSLGISNPGGITWQSPELSISSDGLYRPSMSSPLIDAAVGDYPSITNDFDGQNRTSRFDVGCDELSSDSITIRPLTAEDVGVTWFVPGPLSLEIVAGENTLLDAISLLGDEDTLKLITDGGLYQLTEKLSVNRQIIIKAASGLAEKPVVTRSVIDSGDSVLIEMNMQGKLYLDGVILDGGANTENRISAIISSSVSQFSVYFRIKANNCEFRAISNNGNGSLIRLLAGSQADSVIFTNCLFTDCDGMAIRMNEETKGSGKFNVQYFQIDNCTFWDIASEAVNIYGGDSSLFTIGPSVKIEHCTFDNCGFSGTPTINLADVDNAVIRNSIISNSSPDTASVIIYGWAYIEYCNIFNSGLVSLNRGAHQYNGMINVDPQYYDASRGDFRLADSSPVLTAGSDGKALGDLRWVQSSSNEISHNGRISIKKFAIFRNYPNPFNEATQIVFILEKSAQVKIEIYDLNGKLVTQFNETYTIPGQYSVNWQPDRVASGIYFCRLATGNLSKMIKIMYLK